MIAVPSIHPQNYCDKKIFQKEQERIFQSSWIFVGFKDQLANHNDYITLKIGGTPVVVQNFDGEINALLNICSHRKATLQTEKSGNRPLRCPYHCWNYKKGGELVSVPQNKTDFDLDKEAKSELSLSKFGLDFCGDFVFVRIDQSGVDLVGYLGPYFDVLEELSDSFVEPVQSGIFDWKTNWKVAVETVLEVYHVSGVHPESFSKLAKAECEILSYPPHNTGNTPLQDTPKKWWAGVRKLLKLSQNLTYIEYNHFFIYPNLAIGLTNGSLMSVQTYEPLTVDSCQLNFRLRMIGSNEDVKVSEEVKNQVKANFTEFNRVTLEEDRVVAESCQENMQHVNVPSLLGLCEHRLKHFHTAWRKSMEQHY